MDDSGHETTIFGTRDEAERHKAEGEIVMGLYFLGPVPEGFGK